MSFSQYELVLIIVAMSANFNPPEGQKTAVRSPRTAPDREQEFLPRWRQPPAAADPTEKRPRAPGQGQGAPAWAPCCGTRRPLREHHAREIRHSEPAWAPEDASTGWGKKAIAARAAGRWGVIKMQKLI